MNIYVVIIAVVVLLCGVIVFFERRRYVNLVNRLNVLLDGGISRNFSEKNYDETNFSKIETKLWRLMNSTSLSQNKIEKDNARIQSLIGDISHQTKTPIANILLYTELLLEKEDLSQEARELAKQIFPYTEKLNFLIQSLIKTSRLEMGLIEVQPKENNVKELIDSAYREYIPLAKEKDVSISILNNSDEYGKFDMKWMREAIQNIIDNGIKYTPSGGRIEIDYIPYEMFIRINISDSGIGILEAEYGMLFERFWRGKSVSDQEGVGIGLYLTREIISKQGGYIKVNSRENRGTTFSVFLPR